MLAFLTTYLNACADAGGRPPHGTTLEPFLTWQPDPGNTTENRDPDDTVPPDHHGPAP